MMASRPCGSRTSCLRLLARVSARSSSSDLVEARWDAAGYDHGSDYEGRLDDVVGCEVVAGYFVNGGCDATAEEDGGPIAVFVGEEVSELLMDYKVGLCWR